MISHDVDSIQDEQFEDGDELVDYSDVIIGNYRDQIKLFIDWFVVQYYPLITKRCRIASFGNRNRGAFEDLRSQCIIEAYAIGERYDPTKGDLLKFLLSSLWFFPFRDNNLREIESDETIESLNSIAATASDSTNQVDYNRPSFAKLIEPLSEHDKLLMQLKYGFNMSNGSIAEYLCTSESTVRYWLGAANKKILDNKQRGIGVD